MGPSGAVEESHELRDAIEAMSCKGLAAFQDNLFTESLHFVVDGTLPKKRRCFLRVVAAAMQVIDVPAWAPLGGLQVISFSAPQAKWEKPFVENTEFMSTAPALFVITGISK